MEPVWAHSQEPVGSFTLEEPGRLIHMEPVGSFTWEPAGHLHGSRQGLIHMQPQSFTWSQAWSTWELGRLISWNGRLIHMGAAGSWPTWLGGVYSHGAVALAGCRLIHMEPQAWSTWSRQAHSWEPVGHSHGSR